MINRLDRLVQLGRIAREGIPDILQLLKNAELSRTKLSEKYDDPKCLVRFGAKYFSQNDEDGIIAEIFSRIGISNRSFIEFGVGNGLENNTLLLLFSGWRGLWIEGDKANYGAIAKGFERVVESGKLKIVNQFADPENINEIIQKVFSGEIDLLSVDIDGNDLHVLSAIKAVSPRVLVLEYNAKFPPPIKYVMPFSKTHSWNGSDNYGCSLQAACEELDRGYRLVCCDLTGTNAFFVRKDLVEEKFLEPGSASRHFEPARYHLSKMTRGHFPNYETLNNFSAAQ
jgi:hypothetical protein